MEFYFPSTNLNSDPNQSHSDLISTNWVEVETTEDDKSFTINGFRLMKRFVGQKLEVEDDNQPQFSLSAPTTKANLYKLAKSLLISKPILLEGSSGVGKSTLVAMLSKMTQNTLIKIHLNGNTDMIDLLGMYTPT